MATPQEPSRDPSAVFTPTAPIDEKSLFQGRTHQIRSVIRAISQKGQHAILFGERGVGKTSLANVIASFLQTPQQPSGILSPRVNCDSLDTFESLWRKVLDEIWMHRKINAIGFGSSAQQQTYSSTELLGDSATPDSVRRALTIISTNSLPILIIDEFDRLVSEVKRGVADTIKTLSDHAVAATVLLVGVADSVGELIEQHQSVERALIQIPLPRMHYAEIEDVITTGMKRLGLSIDQPALQRVCTLAQGLPHYAHLIGLESASIAVERGVKNIDLSLLSAAIETSISHSQESVKRTWHQATTSQRRDNLFADVLLACALAGTDELGYFAAQDVRAPLSEILGRPVEIANYAQHLTDFCEPKRGPVLQRIGEKRRFRFRFQNPLVQPYVVMKGFASAKISDSILLGKQSPTA